MLNFLGRTSLTLSVVLVAAAMGLVYSGMRISGEAMVVTVSAGDNFFSPASLTVPAGSTVTWSNDGALPHTATSDTGGWDSSMLRAGQAFSQVFASAGTFPYNCSFHPEMVATVVVEASAAAPTAVPQSTPAPVANNAAPPAAAPQQAAPAPGAAAMPVGGGPPSIDGSSLAGAMILAGLGALLALAGTGALVAGARIENRRPA